MMEEDTTITEAERKVFEESAAAPPPAQEALTLKPNDTIDTEEKLAALFNLLHKPHGADPGLNTGIEDNDDYYLWLGLHTQPKDTLLEKFNIKSSFMINTRKICTGNTDKVSFAALMQQQVGALVFGEDGNFPGSEKGKSRSPFSAHPKMLDKVLTFHQKMLSNPSTRNLPPHSLYLLGCALSATPKIFSDVSATIKLALISGIEAKVNSANAYQTFAEQLDKEDIQTLQGASDTSFISKLGTVLQQVAAEAGHVGAEIFIGQANYKSSIAFKGKASLKKACAEQASKFLSSACLKLINLIEKYPDHEPFKAAYREAFQALSNAAARYPTNALVTMRYLMVTQTIPERLQEKPDATKPKRRRTFRKPATPRTPKTGDEIVIMLSHCLTKSKASPPAQQLAAMMKALDEQPLFVPNAPIHNLAELLNIAATSTGVYQQLEGNPEALQSQALLAAWIKQKGTISEGPHAGDPIYQYTKLRDASFNATAGLKNPEDDTHYSSEQALFTGYTLATSHDKYFQGPIKDIMFDRYAQQLFRHIELAQADPDSKVANSAANVQLRVLWALGCQLKLRIEALETSRLTESSTTSADEALALLQDAVGGAEAVKEDELSLLESDSYRSLGAKLLELGTHLGSKIADTRAALAFKAPERTELEWHVDDEETDAFEDLRIVPSVNPRQTMLLFGAKLGPYTGPSPQGNRVSTVFTGADDPEARFAAGGRSVSVFETLSAAELPRVYQSEDDTEEEPDGLYDTPALAGMVKKEAMKQKEAIATALEKLKAKVAISMPGETDTKVNKMLQASPIKKITKSAKDAGYVSLMKSVIKDFKIGGDATAHKLYTNTDITELGNLKYFVVEGLQSIMLRRFTEAMITAQAEALQDPQDADATSLLNFHFSLAHTLLHYFHETEQAQTDAYKVLYEFASITGPELCARFGQAEQWRDDLLPEMADDAYLDAEELYGPTELDDAASDSPLFDDGRENSADDLGQADGHGASTAKMQSRLAASSEVRRKPVELSLGVKLYREVIAPLDEAIGTDDSINLSQCLAEYYKKNKQAFNMISGTFKQSLRSADSARALFDAIKETQKHPTQMDVMVATALWINCTNKFIKPLKNELETYLTHHNKFGSTATLLGMEVGPPVTPFRANGAAADDDIYEAVGVRADTDADDLFAGYPFGQPPPVTATAAFHQPKNTGRSKNPFDNIPDEEFETLKGRQSPTPGENPFT